MKKDINLLELKEAIGEEAKKNKEQVISLASDDDDDDLPCDSWSYNPIDDKFVEKSFTF